MGSSTFGSFEIGRRAIHAQQKGAQVSGQNIANANTEGYSRQMVHMKALVPPAVPGVITPPGYGVAISDISRVKSEFYSGQIMKGLTAQNYWERLGETLSGIEVILLEPGETGINVYLSEFFDAWHEVSVNPESAAERINLRDQAASLTAVVRDIYDRLDEFKFDVQKELEAGVGEVNSIAEEITVLNREIMHMQALGKKSNELLDQRDLLLQELSEHLDIRVIHKSNGSTEVIAGGRILLHDDHFFPVEPHYRDDGEVEIHTEKGAALFVNGGTLKGLMQSYNETFPKYQGALDELVYNIIREVNALHRQGFGLDGSTGVNFFHQPLEPMPGDIVILNEDLIELGESDETNVTGVSMEKWPDSVKLLQGDYTIETADDVDENSAAAGVVSTYSLSQAGDLVNGVSINNDNDINSSILFEVTRLEGDHIYVNYSLYHTAKDGEISYGEGVKKFTAGDVNSNTYVCEEGREITLDIELGEIGNFSSGDKFVVNVKAQGEQDEFDDPAGDSIILKDSQGNVIYEAVLNDGGFDGKTNTLRFFQLDEESGEHRDVALNVTVEELITEQADPDADPPVLPAASFTVGPYEPEDLREYISRIAADFRVSDAVLNDIAVIAAAAVKDAPGDGSSALEIARLREKAVMEGGTATFHDYFRGVIADLGVEGRESERMLEAMTAVVEQMKEQQESIAGVSLDDEMLNLIQFQHAYNAAARFMNIFDQMLAVLINDMGR